MMTSDPQLKIAVAFKFQDKVNFISHLDFYSILHIPQREVFSSQHLHRH